MADELSTTLMETKTLTIDQVRNFFDQHIKTYYPYRDDKVYSTLISNLVEYYYNNIYNVIPQELKEFIEQYNIDDVDLYDRLLVDIGVPNTLIQQLTYNEKSIFLKSLVDFYQYKSTLKFVQNVGQAYNEIDRINIYELYIDYNIAQIQPWILKPINIHHHNQVDLVEDPLDYFEAYNKIPSLLVELERLSAMRDNNELILPIKSNILFLDYTSYMQISLLNSLIVVTFLKEYKDNYIDIYFADGNSFNCKLSTICFAWYYLISQYHNYDWPAIGNNPIYIPIILAMLYDSSTYPYSITDLDWLITDYNNIDVGTDWPAYYDEYGNLIIDYTISSKINKRDTYYQDNLSMRMVGIIQYFLTQTTYQDITLLQMQGILRTLDRNLGSYLDSKLISSDVDIENLLSNMYISLQLYINSCELTIPKFFEYSDYFMEFLPKIIENPTSTATYKILQTLKPYHVELYSRFQEILICNDKFNSVWVETGVVDYRFLLNEVSVFNASDVFDIIGGLEWESGHNYVFGEGLYVSGINDYFYVVDIGGISDIVEPIWPEVTDAIIVDGTITWRCIQYQLTTQWESGHTYIIGEKICVPSIDHYFYVVDIGGISDIVEPIWPLISGNTITDNTVTWRCVAY